MLIDPMFTNALSMTRGMFEVYQMDRAVPPKIKQAMRDLRNASSYLEGLLLDAQIYEAAHK